MNICHRETGDNERETDDRKCEMAVNDCEMPVFIRVLVFGG
jgi:hypothetical protein